MGYGERTIWVQTVVSAGGAVVYLLLVVPALAGGAAVDAIDWMLPMLGSIVGAIVVSILVNICWGIIAGMREREAAGASDHRDREIGWFGDRVGQAFLVIGGVAGLLLTMSGAERFWIGNAIYAGFVLSALLGGTARIIAYRRGF